LTIQSRYDELSRKYLVAEKRIQELNSQLNDKQEILIRISKLEEEKKPLQLMIEKKRITKGSGLNDVKVRAEEKRAECEECKSSFQQRAGNNYPTPRLSPCSYVCSEATKLGAEVQNIEAEIAALQKQIDSIDSQVKTLITKL
jgi:DNA repair exonuclease SbcCD ATPase subunit